MLSPPETAVPEATWSAADRLADTFTRRDAAAAGDGSERHRGWADRGNIPERDGTWSAHQEVSAGFLAVVRYHRPVREVEASVVIPAKNAASTISVQLDALAAQSGDVPFEVVVVDNGSTDATVPIAGAYADRLRIRVVRCPRAGANAARNFGATAAAGDALLFCDADDRVHPTWVAAMSAALREHDAAGGTIDNDSLSGDFSGGWMPRHPAGVPVMAGFLPRAITANFGVRKEVWAALGGFDEDYAYGCTDTEFCWRLQLAAYSLGYAEDAVVAYRHRADLRASALKAYKTGRARGRLFRDFRAAGMPQPRLAGAVVRWLRLLAMVPVVPFSPRARWWWVNQSAAAAGRVAGSIAFRVRYL